MAPIQSGNLMTLHEQRLIALADVLMIPDPNNVVKALRRRNVMYVDGDGSLLLDPGQQWSDERLVEGAARLFLTDTDDVEPRVRGRAASRSVPRDLRP